MVTFREGNLVIRVGAGEPSFLPYSLLYPDLFITVQFVCMHASMCGAFFVI